MSRWLSSLQMVRAAAGLPRSQLFPSPRHGVGQGAETFTCHHAAGRSGTSIRSSRLSLYSFTSLSSCSAAPLNPPNLCVSDTETLIRPWGVVGGVLCRHCFQGKQHYIWNVKKSIFHWVKLSNPAGLELRWVFCADTSCMLGIIELNDRSLHVSPETAQFVSV